MIPGDHVRPNERNGLQAVELQPARRKRDCPKSDLPTANQCQPTRLMSTSSSSPLELEWSITGWRDVREISKSCS